MTTDVLVDALKQALALVELAVDTHLDVCRPQLARGEIVGAAEIAYCFEGWTIRMPLRRRDARPNKRWHTVSEFRETLEEAVQAFAASLDHWATVLK